MIPSQDMSSELPGDVPGEAAVLAEAALSEDWSRPEEDVAWSHLQGQSLFRNPQGISKTGIPRAGL